MSSELIDILAKKFAESTQNQPVYIDWGVRALDYTENDAAAFLHRGDDSAPTLSDALFDEGHAQDESIGESVLYWLKDTPKSDEIFEIINEAGLGDDFDEESLAREVAQQVRDYYFEEVRFDESEFFRSVENGILTYGVLLTTGDPDYVHTTDPELKDAEELLELANGSVGVSPEQLLQAMKEVPDDFYSLWCVVSMPKRVLLDAFHGSKTIEVSSPTIYIGNYGMGAFFDFKMSGTLKVKLDDMSPYFPYLNEYEAADVE